MEKTAEFRITCPIVLIDITHPSFYEGERGSEAYDIYVDHTEKIKTIREYMEET